MSQRPPKNIPASVRRRLLNHARESGESFDQVLIYYAMERFLYRLARTDSGDRLILKGAMMLRAWGTPLGRPTRDIDFVARRKLSPADLRMLVDECVSMACAEDGIAFTDVSDAQEIVIADRYPGVRIVLSGDLDAARFKVQIDVGMDDAIVPDPAWVEHPTILDLDAPRILAYRPETAIAEKFESIVRLGRDNSRLKDFYDIWLLACRRPFEGPVLRAAMSATFRHRDTDIPRRAPLALSGVFHGSDAPRARWRAFLRRGSVEAPGELAEVCDAIADFIMPVATTASSGVEFEQDWIPGEGWHPR